MTDLTRTQKKALRVIRHRGPSTVKSLVNSVGVCGDHLYHDVLEPMVRQGLLRKSINQGGGGYGRAWYEIAP